MPNMRSVSPVGRDEGGRSYVAQTINERRPGWATDNMHI